MSTFVEQVTVHHREGVSNKTHKEHIVRAIVAEINAFKKPHGRWPRNLVSRRIAFVITNSIDSGAMPSLVAAHLLRKNIIQLMHTFEAAESNALRASLYDTVSLFLILFQDLSYTFPQVRCL